MTVGELLERLQDLDPEMEIRLMTQMNWPFENGIVGVCTRTEMHAEKEPGGEPDAEDGGDILYIVEGQQLCYGDSAAWDAAW